MNIIKSNKSPRITKHSETTGTKENKAVEGAVILGLIIGGTIFVYGGNFLTSIIPVLLLPTLCAFGKAHRPETIKTTTQISSFQPKRKNVVAKTRKLASLQDKDIVTIIEPNINVIIHNTVPKIIPIQERLSTLYPNQAGLYPHEILVLQIFNIFPLDNDNNSFPKYWWYQYGVKDVQKLINFLKDRGFIGYPEISSIEAFLYGLKVADLRDIIKQHALKTARKKSDMVQNILSGLSETDLAKLIPQSPKNYYVITEKGKQAIKDDEYVLYAHRKSNRSEWIDVYTLNQEMHGDTRNYRYYVRRILDTKYIEGLKNNDYAMCTRARLQISEFFSEEEHFDEALKMIAEAIYLELSGTYLDYPGKKGESLLNYDPIYTISIFTIPPGIINRLCYYQEKLQINNNVLAEILANTFSKISLPFHIFTEAECVQITLLSIDGDEEKIKKIYNDARGRLQRKYPKIKFN